MGEGGASHRFYLAPSAKLGVCRLGEALMMLKLICQLLIVAEMTPWMPIKDEKEWLRIHYLEQYIRLNAMLAIDRQVLHQKEARHTTSFIDWQTPP
jgi:hypothetical protein